MTVLLEARLYLDMWLWLHSDDLAAALRCSKGSRALISEVMACSSFPFCLWLWDFGQILSLSEPVSLP